MVIDLLSKIDESYLYKDIVIVIVRYALKNVRNAKYAMTRNGINAINYWSENIFKG